MLANKLKQIIQMEFYFKFPIFKMNTLIQIITLKMLDMKGLVPKVEGKNLYKFYNDYIRCRWFSSRKEWDRLHMPDLNRWYFDFPSACIFLQCCYCVSNYIFLDCFFNWVIWKMCYCGVEWFIRTLRWITKLDWRAFTS